MGHDITMKPYAAVPSEVASIFLGAPHPEPATVEVDASLPPTVPPSPVAAPELDAVP